MNSKIMAIMMIAMIAMVPAIAAAGTWTGTTTISGAFLATTNTAPVITGAQVTTSHSALTDGVTDIKVSATITDDATIDTVTYSLNGGVSTEMVLSSTANVYEAPIGALAAGAHKVIITATDDMGAFSTATVDFTVVVENFVVSAITFANVPYSATATTMTGTFTVTSTSGIIPTNVIITPADITYTDGTVTVNKTPITKVGSSTGYTITVPTTSGTPINGAAFSGQSWDVKIDY